MQTGILQEALPPASPALRPTPLLLLCGRLETCPVVDADRPAEFSPSVLVARLWSRAHHVVGFGEAPHLCTYSAPATSEAPASTLQRYTFADLYCFLMFPSCSALACCWGHSLDHRLISYSQYGAYHHNSVNKFIHIVCVPVILVSAFAMVSKLATSPCTQANFTFKFQSPTQSNGCLLRLPIRAL